MKHLRSALAVLAIAAVGLLAPATARAAEPAAQPASQTVEQTIDLTELSNLAAGNGTANFYLTGSVGHNFGLGVWGDCDFTNYDNGTASQIYHHSTHRSGVGVIAELFINGHNYGTALEHYVAVGGHGRYTVGCRFHLVGSPTGYLKSISL